MGKPSPPSQPEIIAAGNRNGIVELWYADGTKYREFDLGASITALAFWEQRVLVASTEKGLIPLHVPDDARD